MKTKLTHDEKEQVKSLAFFVQTMCHLNPGHMLSAEQIRTYLPIADNVMEELNERVKKAQR